MRGRIEKERGARETESVCEREQESVRERERQREQKEREVVREIASENVRS